MRGKRCLLFLACLTLLSTRASSQTKLENLINYALEHSREIQKSDLQIQQAEYMRKETLGNGLPQVEGSASYSKMMFDKINIPASVYSAIPENYAPFLDQLSNIDKIYMASAGIQVSQLIYSQSYWLGLHAAKKTQELYSILKNKNEEEVIAEVAEGYYQAGSLLLQHQTVRKSLKNLEKIFHMVKLNYQSNLIKETDVSRLKVTMTNLEVTEKTINNAINTQLNYLKALAGMPADSAILLDSASLVGSFEDSSPISGFYAENIPSYNALLKQAEIYEQQTRLSKAKYLPTLAAFGKFNYSSYNINSNMSKWQNMTTLGLSLTVPIFNSGVTNAQVKQSVLKQKELEQDILQTKDLLAVDFQNASSEFETAKNLLVVQKENRELAQKVYNQTALQYQEGMASLADLLNVNSDFLQADNSYNQQILKCKTSEIKMLKSSGNLKKVLINNNIR